MSDTEPTSKTKKLRLVDDDETNENQEISCVSALRQLRGIHAACRDLRNHIVNGGDHG
jgi:hypothetical protein